MRIDEYGIEYKYPCPCCDTQDMIQEEGMHDICVICGWHDDPYQRRHLNDNGANWMSLNRARENYAHHSSIWSEKDKQECIKHRKAYGFKTDNIETIVCNEPTEPAAVAT